LGGYWGFLRVYAIAYHKFAIELQALGMIGTSCKLAPAGMGVCKTPLHNILQELLIIRVIKFAKGRSTTSN